MRKRASVKKLVASNNLYLENGIFADYFIIIFELGAKLRANLVAENIGKSGATK